MKPLDGNLPTGRRPAPLPAQLGARPGSRCPAAPLGPVRGGGGRLPAAGGGVGKGERGVRWKREQALPNCPTLDLKKKVVFRRGPTRRRKSGVNYSCCLYPRNRIARKGKIPLTKPAGTKIRLNALGHRAAERSPLRSCWSGTEPAAGPTGAFSFGSPACFPSRSLCLQNSATFPYH